MIRQMTTTAKNARDTLLADAIGAAALMVTLVVGLHLPSLF